MKSFLKIYGPPLLQALMELEKIAIKMPDVCMMSSPIALHLPKELVKDMSGYSGYENGPRYADSELPEFAWNFFSSSRSELIVSREICENILSNSGIELGKYDFYFEWRKKPSSKNIEELIHEIDIALEPLGCRYTIETK